MSDAIVDVQHVTRRFRDKTALNDVSLSIPKGIVFGLVGENGAGKTTLLKHLLGLLQPDEGSVQVFGIDPVKQPELVLARLGYLSEDRDMPDWMRVDQVIAYRSAFYPNWDHAYAADLIRTFDLPTRPASENTVTRAARSTGPVAGDRLSTGITDTRRTVVGT